MLFPSKSSSHELLEVKYYITLNYLFSSAKFRVIKDFCRHSGSINDFFISLMSSERAKEGFLYVRFFFMFSFSTFSALSSPRIYHMLTLFLVYFSSGNAYTFMFEEMELNEDILYAKKLLFPWHSKMLLGKLHETFFLWLKLNF